MQLGCALALLGASSSGALAAQGSAQQVHLLGTVGKC